MDKVQRVVVPMPAAMKERLLAYTSTVAAKERGHTELAQICRIALDLFLSKQGA